MKAAEAAIQQMNAAKHPDMSTASAVELLREIFGGFKLPPKEIPNSNPFDISVNVQMLRRAKELLRVLDMVEKSGGLW